MNEKDKTELINFRIKRAFETYGEVSLHVENQLWTTAIKRLYYACYYAVIAVLAKNNIFPKSHAGARSQFGLHLIKTGKLPLEIGIFYSQLANKRQSGDYDDFIEFEKEEVIDMLKPAKELIESIEKLL